MVPPPLVAGPLALVEPGIGTTGAAVWTGAAEGSGAELDMAGGTAATEDSAPVADADGAEFTGAEAAAVATAEASAGLAGCWVGSVGGFADGRNSARPTNGMQIAATMPMTMAPPTMRRRVAGGGSVDRLDPVVDSAPAIDTDECVASTPVGVSPALMMCDPDAGVCCTGSAAVASMAAVLF